MVWIALIIGVAFHVSLLLFRRAINNQFDRKGPVKEDPDLLELYKLVGKAKTHRLMTQMKRDYPLKSKQWVIQQLTKGLRNGKIKP